MDWNISWSISLQIFLRYTAFSHIVFFLGKLTYYHNMSSSFYGDYHVTRILLVPVQVVKRYTNMILDDIQALAGVNHASNSIP